LGVYYWGLKESGGAAVSQKNSYVVIWAAPRQERHRKRAVLVASKSRKGPVEEAMGLRKKNARRAPVHAGRGRASRCVQRKGGRQSEVRTANEKMDLIAEDLRERKWLSKIGGGQENQ